MPLKASQGINSDCISAAFRYVPEIPRCSNVYASSRTKACVCARVEYHMFGRRCVSCKSGLSSRVPTAPTHTIRLYRRDSTRRSLERGLIGGDERSRGSGSNRFLPGSRWVSSKRRRADLVILQSPPDGLQVNNHNTRGLILLHDWVAQIGSASAGIVSANSASLEQNVFLIRNTINSLPQQHP